MNTLQIGTYQHYKGKKYLVLGIAKHSETKEDLVLYVTLYENDIAAPQLIGCGWHPIFDEIEICVMAR